jgi:hypothetical protein
MKCTLVILLACCSQPQAMPEPRFRSELFKSHPPIFNLTHPRIVQYFSTIRGATGTCVASSPEEYRVYAEECFDWARTARTERERDIFLQMARTWLEAAVRASSKTRSTYTVPINNAARQLSEKATGRF